VSLPDPKRKASHRHGASDDEPNLNLNPMMDMFAVLIPALLMLSAVLEISVLNVNVPEIKEPGVAANEKPADAQEDLTLTLNINARGYDIAASGGVISGEPTGEGGVHAPAIPLIQKKVSCSRYRNYWPPPRAINKQAPMCDDPYATKTFTVYDNEALLKRLRELKTVYPNERRIILLAAPSIEYEVVTDAMDVARGFRNADGTFATLFDDVTVSPGFVE
jgi:biopolymer transport protein ExbD